ncbi:MAG: tetratricopeptide domain-containing protein [Ignavibacteria bacterium]|nr:MAG: tetratricopeptide domain-containing protein [Ignavibacteria bacterium]KAF0162438.1 MAG: tetratricopeptide domain-containing protein [Ignavibacteria bacterium]
MKQILLILISLLTFFACTSVEKVNKETTKVERALDPKKAAKAAFIEGSVLELKGQTTEAIKLYTEAYSLDAQPGIAYALSKNYLKINKLGSALGYSKLAVEADHNNVEYLSLLALIYNASNNPDSSEVVYRAVLAIDTANVSAYFNLAQIYESKRPSESLAMYKKIVELVGPEWTVLVRIVDLNERLGNIEGTISTVEELLNLNPADLSLQKVLIDAYIKTKKYDKAIKMIDEALVSFPNDLNLVEFRGMTLVQKGEMKNASIEYLKLVKEKTIPFENKIRVGLSFLADAEKDSVSLFLAKNIFEEINQDTSDWQVKSYLGEIEIRNDNVKDAIKYFEDAANLAEWNPDVWVRMGGLLFDSRKYDETIKFMEQAVQKFPNNFPINLIYGLALSQKNKHEMARDILKRALNLNPNDVTVLGALGYTLNQLKQDEEALVVLNRALKNDPNNLQVLSIAALIHESNKNYVVSDSLYARAMKLDSTNALILNNLAYSWAEREIKLDEALNMAQKAVEAEPKNSSYLDTIGWIYFKLGNYKKAKENIEAAVEIEKDNATLIDHLGDVYFKLGDKKKALTNWKKAFEKDSTKTEIKLKIEKGEL